MGIVQKKVSKCKLFCFPRQKGYMVWTKSMTTSPGHQESRNASSHPNRAPPPSMIIQQQLQSMAAVMAELTQQNQELTREVNRQRQ